ncbi:hypothetical protein ACQKGD_27575 [Peribacillus frigoritolerans]|uniref:hypothetical protein n=1 Tax=Peribacillus frigoritolerans TaxID=450367 RepID=UPI003D038FE7
MGKTEVLEWNSFMKGECKSKSDSKKVIPSIVTGAFLVNKASIVLAATSIAPAADSTGLAKLIFEILGIADYIAWGGLIFAGASWMFSNRTVAVERAVGVTAGYLIIRKSWAYVQFLKGV